MEAAGYSTPETAMLPGVSGLSDPLQAASSQRSAEQARGVPFYRLQHLFRVRPVFRNGDRGDHRILPRIEEIDLGYRHVEALPQSVLKTLDYVPLFFK